jgi:outer membrane protein OmpA-like peptidoglycan-associated protein
MKGGGALIKHGGPLRLARRTRGCSLVHYGVFLVTVAALATCVERLACTQPVAGSYEGTRRVPTVAVVDLKSLPDTIGIEHEDRINRFARMAAMAGIRPPEVDDMQLAAGDVPGFNYPIPVVRVRFAEQVFFDFNKDSIRSDADKILDVIAENMKRDVPDAQLTILGHTDAIGSDAYNFDLSRRRAESVMEALADRGVRLGQMSTVAVGKTQPIAPNTSDEGRARNRRVEFMISASERANLLLVSKRRVIAEWLNVDATENRRVAAPPKLAVLRPVPIERAQVGSVHIRLAETSTVETKEPIPESTLAAIAPPPDIKLMTPKEFHQAQLNTEFDL